jgi:hypothetical protein
MTICRLLGIVIALHLGFAISKLPGQARITVGPNIQVSQAKGDLSFAEATACADPSTPRLVAAAMYNVPLADSARTSRQATLVFASADGGRTWLPTLDTKAPNRSTPDPACAFGSKGEVYFSVMQVEGDRGPLLVYRSVDGGRTWAAPSQLGVGMSGGLDREFLAVDLSGGQNRGTVYVTAFRDSRAPLARDFVLFRSSTDGTFGGAPVSQPSHYFHNGNVVVLSDGSIIALRVHPQTRAQESPALPEPSGGWPANAVVSVVRSRDGGLSVLPPVTVSPLTTRTTSNRFLLTDFIPTLAADIRSTKFRDRIYAAWIDATRGRTRVMLSFSADSGASWSTPRAVTDEADSDPLNPERGPDNINPTLAVNPEGVVGLLWYDRRDSPDFGYWPRFAASLDGGETWSASIRVSTHPQVARLDGVNAHAWPRQARANTEHEFVFEVHGGWNFRGGDTAGLVADANGQFHAFWIDNRTGQSQIWSAAIRVDGLVKRMRDVSSAMSFRLTNVQFDTATRVLSADVTLQNTSDAPVVLPLSVHVLTVRSGISASVAVLDATNGIPRPGAVWSFGSNSQDVLRPGAVIVKKVRFQMSPWYRAAINPLAVTVRVLEAQR